MIYFFFVPAEIFNELCTKIKKRVMSTNKAMSDDKFSA